MTILNSTALELDNSKGRLTERLQFSGLEACSSVKIAVQRPGILDRLTSCCCWRWVPTVIKNASGTEERILVNIRSAAKRLSISSSRVIELCRNGELEWEVKNNESKIKKTDSLLPHLKLKNTDQAKQIISFIEEVSKKKKSMSSEKGVEIIVPRDTSQKIIYDDGKFYLMKRFLGRGSFKEAFEVCQINIETPADLFVFLTPLNSGIQNQGIDTIKREMDFLKRLKDKDGFTKTFGFLEFNKNPIFLQQFYELGDLVDVSKNIPLSLKDKLGIARDILKSLVVLEKEKICHNDLKPDNIFLTRVNEPGARSRIKAVLGDFGFSYDVEAKDAPWYSGTRAYSAPEKFQEYQSRELPGLKGDVWSAGIVFYHLFKAELSGNFKRNADLNRLEPFPGFWHGELISHAENSLEYLICLMLQRDANDRPSASEAIESLKKIIAQTL